jgi:hypothetical protein
LLDRFPSVDNSKLVIVGHDVGAVAALQKALNMQLQALRDRDSVLHAADDNTTRTEDDTTRTAAQPALETKKRVLAVVMLDPSLLPGVDPPPTLETRGTDTLLPARAAGAGPDAERQDGGSEDEPRARAAMAQLSLEQDALQDRAERRCLNAHSGVRTEDSRERWAEEREVGAQVGTGGKSGGQVGGQERGRGEHGWGSIGPSISELVGQVCEAM